MYLCLYNMLIPKYSTLQNLVCGKNVLIDMSIHTAYVKAIRAAQHYIYIENQYFIGSSFNWNSNKDIGKGHQKKISHETQCNSHSTVL